MKIDINGHNERYTLESMALLFYPASSFADDSDNRRVTSDFDGKICTTIIYDNGKEISASAKIVFKEDRRAVQLCIARSFFKAAKKLTKINPPWGILVGIRPSKVAHEFLNFENAAHLMHKKYKVKKAKAEMALSVAKIEQDINIPKNSVSLYISIPFCPSKCSYCSFVSQSVEKAAKLIPGYLETLFFELEEYSKIVREYNLVVETIYIGGGTPSVLEADMIKSLLSQVQRLFDTKKLLEYTFEAGRPDTITEEKLLVLKEYGITRISINPQTMNDKVRKGLGRRHSTKEIIEKYNLAKDCGLENINMDVIAGLPNESYSSFAKGLNEIINLNPSGITIHTLSQKRSATAFLENSELYKTAGKVRKMVDFSQKLLMQRGYSPYYLYRQKNTLGNLENVGYCIKNRYGRYNIITMGELQTVLAAGGGAVSKVVFGDGRIERVFNAKYPFEYTNTDKIKSNIKALRLLLKQVT